MNLFSLGVIVVPNNGTLVRVSNDKKARATALRFAVPVANSGGAYLYADTPNDAAQVMGTLLGPFHIVGGVNDALTVAIDGGSDQVVTLNAGVGLFTENIAQDLAGKLTGCRVYSNRGQITIESLLLGTGEVNLKTVADSCYATLGLTVADITATAVGLYAEFVKPTANTPTQFLEIRGTGSDNFIHLYQLLVDVDNDNDGLLVSGVKA